MRLLRKLIILVCVLFVAGIFLVRTNWFWNAMSPIFHKNLLYKYAGEYKIDPLLIAAIIQVESKFNPLATSSKGALGLMQLLPETAKEIAKELNIDFVNNEDLYKSDKNIKMGFYYMAKLMREFNGNLIFALAGYNAGLTKAKKWAEDYHGEDDATVIEKIPIEETKNFVKKVMQNYNRFKFIQKTKRTLQFK